MTPDFDNPFAIIGRHQKVAPVDADAIARDLGLKVHREVLEEDIYGKLLHDQARGGWSGYAAS